MTVLRLKCIKSVWRPGCSGPRPSERAYVEYALTSLLICTACSLLRSSETWLEFHVQDQAASCSELRRMGWGGMTVELTTTYTGISGMGRRYCIHFPRGKVSADDALQYYTRPYLKNARFGAFS